MKKGQPGGTDNSGADLKRRQKKMHNPGDIVEIDGQLAVVVGTGRQGSAPEDHLAVWFGEPKTARGQPGGKTPEVWTIPEEYFTKAKKPNVMH